MARNGKIYRQHVKKARLVRKIKKALTASILHHLLWCDTHKIEVDSETGLIPIGTTEQWELVETENLETKAKESSRK